MENVERVVLESDALPFSDLDDSHLHHTISWELQHQPNYTFPYEGCLLDLPTKVEVGDDYYRIYDFSVDSTFNTVKAAMMREERMKRRKQLQFKDLTTLFKMPFEIVLMVFDHLHPMDLYHVGMVSRSMRKFVYSRTAIWESAWEASGMPQLPIGWTYKQWTSFLLGPAICDNCGKFVALPDYAHLKRYCTKCIASEFTWEDFTADPFLASMVPGTIRNKGWDVTINYFSESDDYGSRSKTRIRLMRDKIKELRAEIKGNPVGDELLARFIQTTQEEVHKHMEYARRCDEWALDIFTEFSRVTTESHHRTLQRLQKTLKKQGFVEQDFEKWTDHVLELWHTKELVDLTKSSWKRCVPSFIQIAADEKSERLFRERQERQDQRRQGLLAAYTVYRQKLSPTEWWNFPSPEGVLQLPVCLALVDETSQKVYDEEEFSQFINALTGEFTRWHEDRKEKLISSLPPQFSATSLPIVNQFEFATAVFSCPGCVNNSNAPVLDQVGVAMFGGEEAKRHSTCSHLLTQGGYIEFDPIASKVVLSILEFLGLPETTTAAELDQLNQRFLCGRCALSKQSKVHGLFAMTWRECVFHVFESRRLGLSHNVVGWHLLTPQIYDYVIRREPCDPRPMDKAWYCTHCNTHLSEPVLRHSVVHHLRAEHNIQRPNYSVDVIYSPLETRKARKQLFIPFYPEALLCSLCTAPKDKRFLDRAALSMHIKNKHNVEPNENEHWETVQPVLRSSVDVNSRQFPSPDSDWESEHPETIDAFTALLEVLRDDSD